MGKDFVGRVFNGITIQDWGNKRGRRSRDRIYIIKTNATTAEATMNDFARQFNNLPDQLFVDTEREGRVTLHKSKIYGISCREGFVWNGTPQQNSFFLIYADQ
jgi:hypothetical protein